MVKEICRVCLNNDFRKEFGKGLSLFEKCSDCVISDQINTLTNVAIKEGDGLPDRICPPCLLDLESAYKFKLKCENSNQILLSTVNDATQIEWLDVPIKEENDDEEDFDYVEENITLAYVQAGGTNALSDVKALPKLSRAIDLKLECHDCGRSFKSKCKLRVHWKKVHMEERIKCSNCLKKFKTFAALKSHKKKNLKSCILGAKVRIEGEGRNRVFHCKECDFKAHRIFEVASHLVIHTGERPFQCDICLGTFAHASTLVSHKELVHKSHNTEGTCQFCGKHFQSRIKLMKHMKRHESKSFPCNICNSVLKSKDSLNNHMKRHSGIKSYACDVCPTSFYTSSDLYNHKNMVHVKSKFYTCEICNYKTLQNHLIAKHRPKHSASNVACSVCGTFLDNEQQLALHKKKHTDKHHICPHCDKSYFARKSLCTHIRQVHKIVKLNGSGSTCKVKKKCEE